MTVMTLAPAHSDHSYRAPSEPELRVSPARVRGIEGGPLFPLSSHQAEDLMDRDGTVEVTLLLDQEKYFNHVISSSSGGLTPENYAHDVAFRFGQPREGVTRIIGVSGSAFIVSYSTHVREFLDD